MMKTLAGGVTYCDLLFRDRPGIIASAIVRGPGGIAIIDPGPSSTLPTLRRELAEAGLRIGDVQALLLTHIHLDHAGATGTLVREHPGLRVYVHERGAPHLVNPEKLVASASRLYGDQMDRLWGEVAPVPLDALVALRGGERLEAGGRTFDVAETTGHASHHVSYFSAETGIAFVGDTAGVRLPGANFVLPPTPPPDIDLEAWRDSLDRVAAWNADTLFITHFGPAAQPSAHLDELRTHLDMMFTLAKAILDEAGGEAEQEARFVAAVRLELARRVGEDAAARYETAGRFDLNWRGLARYWRKREAKT